MKKLLLIVSAVAVLATGTVFGVKAYQNSQHPMTDDLMRQNIEALSDAESGYFGDCNNSDGYCQTWCPGCGKLLWIPSQLGPVKRIHGTCTCGYTIDL